MTLVRIKPNSVGHKIQWDKRTNKWHYMTRKFSESAEDDDYEIVVRHGENQVIALLLPGDIEDISMNRPEEWVAVLLDEQPRSFYKDQVERITE